MIKDAILSCLFYIFLAQSLFAIGPAIDPMSLLLNNKNQPFSSTNTFSTQDTSKPSIQENKPYEANSNILYKDLSEIEKIFYDRAVFLHQQLELTEKPLSPNNQITTTDSHPIPNSQFPNSQFPNSQFPNSQFSEYQNINKNQDISDDQQNVLNHKSQDIQDPKNKLNNKLLSFQYGYNIFENNLSHQLNTASYIPVNDNYILGPGDSLIIRIWGKLEERIEENIDQNGNLYLPKIGHITLAGVSFKNAKKIIRKSFSKQFVNIDISITMGQLKTIKVYILGDIKKPGAYNISSLSTLMSALYESGGPLKSGSLRQIELRRNNKTIKSIDLYSYILKGDFSQDPALQANDTIYIPPIGSVVKIEGSVNKQSIFEVKKNESIHTLIHKYAGGINGNAQLNTIRIERNHTGTLKVKTIPVSTSQKELKSLIIHNGDTIVIPKSNLKNMEGIIIKGEIITPGLYEFNKNTNLSSVLEQANGFTEEAVQDKIKISRLNPNNTRSILFVNALTAPQFKLQKNDILTIANQKEYINGSHVNIEGAVHKPGEYPYSHNISLYNLLTLAKVDELAELTNIEIYRNRGNQNETLFTIDASNLFKNSDSKNNITLLPNDIINVRYKKHASQHNRIILSGEVKYPGTYLARENESLESIIERAGGFTSKAFLNGAIFTRANSKEQEATGYQHVLDEEQKRIIYDQSRLANLPKDAQGIYQSSLNFIRKKIIESKGRSIINLSSISNQIIVNNEDTLHIPITPQFIQVVGGVNNPTGVLFQPNKNPKFFISQAGGLTSYAKYKDLLIFKANGAVSRDSSNIEEGDTIYIPEEIKLKASFARIFSGTLDTLVKSLTVVALIKSI